MKRMLLPFAGILLCGVLGAHWAVAEVASDTGVDEHTIALWLFDEPSYGNMTLTDAGPHQIDLRLETTVDLPSREGVPTRLPEAMLEGRRGLVKGRIF